ncbi:hypothetical protein DM227_09310 [Shigella flexneri]|nr:hypothetical protein [Shigella flexneri]
MRKAPQGSFPTDGKEPIIERIFRLVERYPSRNAAARAWGINEGTLKNYYNRRDYAPIPRPHQLKKIAESENVTLEWLMTGEGDVELKDSKEPKKENADNVDAQILMFLSFLKPQEKQQVADVLGRKGAEQLLILLDEHIQELHALVGVRRAIALSLGNLPDEKVREIYALSEAKGDHLNLPQKAASA